MRWFLFLLIALAAVSAFAPVAEAKGKCVVVVPRQADEALVNTCNQCRVVKVERSRSVGGIQGTRTYAVPAQTMVDLTFHGPGKTRVVLERDCSAASEKQADKNETQCVRLKMLRNGKPGLINACPACRRIDLMYATKTQGQKRETHEVDPNAVKILNPAADATDVVILRDRNCGGW